VENFPLNQLLAPEMKNKTQHFVPRSYMTAWCDPNTPQGHEPYVWVHTADGSAKKRRAPDNILSETDYYTFFTEDGDRDLFLEQYLGSVEGTFPRIRDGIKTSLKLPEGEDMQLLCLYSALMLNRTKKQRENMLNSFQQLHEMVVQAEEAHNCPPITSLETERMAKYGHHYMMLQGLEIILNYLYKMNKVLLFCVGKSRFITSDYPAYLDNPQAYRLPPFYRSPGFGIEDVEFFFPLCPEVAFIASWKDVKGAKAIIDEGVDSLNRRTRFKSHEFFITHNGVTNDCWFDPGVEPEDSWENQQRKNGTSQRET
jgi:hypothetical protein